MSGGLGAFIWTVGGLLTSDGGLWWWGSYDDNEILDEWPRPANKPGSWFEGGYGYDAFGVEVWLLGISGVG